MPAAPPNPRIESFGVQIVAPQLPQLQAMLNSIGAQFEEEFLVPMINATGKFAYEAFMTRMHKGDPAIDKHSGRMREMTKITPIEGGVIVGTSAKSDEGYPYPIKENARGGNKKGYGPHKFLEPTIEAVKQLEPEFSKELYQFLISRFGSV